MLEKGSLGQRNRHLAGGAAQHGTGGTTCTLRAQQARAGLPGYCCSVADISGVILGHGGDIKDTGSCCTKYFENASLIVKFL